VDDWGENLAICYLGKSGDSIYYTCAQTEARRAPSKEESEYYWGNGWTLSEIPCGFLFSNALEIALYTET
jgi:hypothetical protein